jgi:hypothetical protein
MSLSRFDRSKRTPAGLLYIENPIECVSKLGLVVAACGTDDVLRESAIIGFHDIARILLLADASCPLLDSLSGPLKTAQTSRLQTGIFLTTACLLPAALFEFTLIQNAAGPCWVSGVEWETRMRLPTS